MVGGSIDSPNSPGMLSYPTIPLQLMQTILDEPIESIEEDEKTKLSRSWAREDKIIAGVLQVSHNDRAALATALRSGIRPHVDIEGGRDLSQALLIVARSIKPDEIFLENLHYRMKQLLTYY